MILRRLYQADRRVGEGRHEVFQPVGMHDIVRIEHPDDLGLRRGMLERKPERARFEALELVGAHEFEAGAEQPAVILDRAPLGGIGRVVDDHHAFEIGPVELRHAVERLPQHLGRFAAGGNMDRHQRHALRQRRSLRQQISPGFAPNRMAASSSIRRFMIKMSGTSSPAPTNSAICEPSTK